MWEVVGQVERGGSPQSSHLFYNLLLAFFIVLFWCYRCVLRELQSEMSSFWHVKMMTCYQKQDFYVLKYKKLSKKKRCSLIFCIIQKLVLSFLLLGFKGFILSKARVSIIYLRIWYYVFVFFFLYFSFYLLWQFCQVVQELYILVYLYIYTCINASWN